VRNLTYLRFELLRTLRNYRFLIFSLGFPLILFLTIAGAHKNLKLDGISFPLYYLSGMTAWGTMSAVISSGARIAQERTVGWTRQLRVTPLKTSDYFLAKVLSGYLMALLNIVVLALAGTLIAVRLSAAQWLTMLGLILVGLIPFAILGILLGHLLTVDTLGPVIGGGTSLLALVGGAYGQLATGGPFLAVVKYIPSYWLVQAGRSALGGGNAWPTQAWIVLAAWSLILARVAARVFRRDTARV